MATAHSHPAGFDFGYARDSTTGQNPERQLSASIPAEQISTDKRSSNPLDRPSLTRVLGYARAGDITVGHILDRFGRSPRDVLNPVHDLACRGIDVRSLADPLPINTTGDGVGRIAFTTNQVTVART